MPKPKSRQHHIHQPSLSPSQLPQYLPQTSHYYTTGPQSQALPPQTQPHYQTRTNADLNLTVLRRHNPRILQILAVAPFAVVYTFSQSTNIDKSPGWEKTGVEGTLFVVQLHEEDGLEHYGVMVLNRKGLENFEAELETKEDVEVSGEFVILQGQGVVDEGGGAGTGITGLWIFSSEGKGEGGGQDVRGIVAGVITECAERAEESRVREGDGRVLGMGYDGAGDGVGDGNAGILQDLFARARPL